MPQLPTFIPARTRPDLLAPSVCAYLQHIDPIGVAAEVDVFEIDPQYMGGAELVSEYGVLPEQAINCIVVAAKTSDHLHYAVCLVPAGVRADLNGVVKTYMEAKGVSMAPLDMVLEQTGMEYGSVTPIGVPAEWSILIDPLVMEQEHVIIGSGLQKAKLRVPSSFLRTLPHAVVVEGLSKKPTESL